MKTLFASAAVVAAGAAPNVVIPTFSEFLARFGKSYEGAELSVREAIYSNNVSSSLPRCATRALRARACATLCASASRSRRWRPSASTTRATTAGGWA